ncbi:unnamed protein product [Enterobius vermicularis]|uniref:TYR_PHOSPHATASE_2 domain-containing protein n=1 Tax=Enterobius vermicularis TaxID=51028 RepID=A0A0N4UZQ8_ENTVE|nr:unnamed protein product [Enterobius vermicularis]
MNNSAVDIKGLGDMGKEQCLCSYFSFRWLNYDPLGQILPGTRFLPFKTPLRADYFKNRGENFRREQVFEITTLVERAAREGHTIGLIIDLTATNKYYDPCELDEFGIDYVKISCRGHSANSDVDAANLFIESVSTFLRNNANNDKLIGVHCTHGLNRTGFLICKYLIEVDSVDPKEAIKRFEYSRGYKIERRRYVNALFDDCVRGCLSYLAAPVNVPRVTSGV